MTSFPCPGGAPDQNPLYREPAGQPPVVIAALDTCAGATRFRRRFRTHSVRLFQEAVLIWPGGFVSVRADRPSLPMSMTLARTSGRRSSARVALADRDDPMAPWSYGRSSHDSVIPGSGLQTSWRHDSAGAARLRDRFLHWAIVGWPQLATPHERVATAVRPQRSRRGMNWVSYDVP
jgi:hypothetical protein